MIVKFYIDYDKNVSIWIYIYCIKKRSITPLDYFISDIKNVMPISNSNFFLIENLIINYKVLV